MNRQWKGIVFVDFREENAPHFILDLIEELQREKIAESIAPCQTFAKSFLMVSPATKRKDLVLLLRPLNEENVSLLEQWRNNQGEQVVMNLSDYVKQYGGEFTGIGQSGESTNDSGDKSEKTDDKDKSKKSKKERKKRNSDNPSEDKVNDETGNETVPDETPPEENAIVNDGSEIPNEVQENQ
jgi:hypothetical protein